MYLYKGQKLTIRKASSATIKPVFDNWDKASFPTCNNQHSITKLESIFGEWKAGPKLGNAAPPKNHLSGPPKNVFLNSDTKERATS